MSTRADFQLGGEAPQHYGSGAALAYVWDVATLSWVKETQPGGGVGSAVSIADGSDVAEGTTTDPAWVSGAGTVIGILKTIASSGAAAGLTDAQLRASAVPVSGTVTASGPLTDTQLRASAVPVSGPLTDAQLRATPVPVSGTVTASGPLTDAQLRATPVPVSGTVTANAGTGTFTTKDVRAGTPAQSSVVASATNVTVLAANANRLGATVYNDPTGGAGANLFLKLGATASATSYTSRLVPNAYYELPYGYTGIVDGIWASAAGNARVTEVTA